MPKQKDTWPTALFVAFATGLRPIELQWGVQIRSMADLGLICILIPSAKHNAFQGQPWRSLWFDKKDMDLSPGHACWPKPLLRQYVALHFGKQTRPYDLRRNFASQLHKNGYCHQTIALALGHDGLGSLKHYLQDPQWPLNCLPIHIEAGLAPVIQPSAFRRRSSSIRPALTSMGVRSRPMDNCSKI